MRTAERGRTAEAEVAPRLGVPAPHFQLRFFDLRDDPGAMLDVGGADVGQREPARGPVDEAHAEPLLELGDALRHRRRCEIEAPRSRDEPTRFRNAEKGLHGLEAVHAIIIRIFETQEPVSAALFLVRCKSILTSDGPITSVTGQSGMKSHVAFKEG